MTESCSSSSSARKPPTMSKLPRRPNGISFYCLTPKYRRLIWKPRKNIQKKTKVEYDAPPGKAISTHRTAPRVSRSHRRRSCFNQGGVGCEDRGFAGHLKRTTKAPDAEEARKSLATEQVFQDRSQTFLKAPPPTPATPPSRSRAARTAAESRPRSDYSGSSPPP